MDKDVESKILEKIDEHDLDFIKINSKLEGIDSKLLEHDDMFMKIENKLVEHDQRFDQIDKRFVSMDKKFSGYLTDHEIRLQRIEETMLTKDEFRLAMDAINEKMDRFWGELKNLDRNEVIREYKLSLLDKRVTKLEKKHIS